MGTQEKTDKTSDQLNNQKYLLITTVLFTIMTLVVGALVFRFYLEDYRKSSDAEEYDKYYVMITDNYKSDFWQAIYKGAFDAAKRQNIYVDLLGQNIQGQYTCEQLMKIAIASRVDGIIVFASENEEMTQLINEANEKKIPVVTLYSDSTHSDRLSFVGVGSYNIGREYGRQIFNLIKEKRSDDFANSQAAIRRTTTDVAVLVNTDTRDSGQNIIISALQETLEQENATDSEFSIFLVPVDNKNIFSVEESIRDIFMNDDIPDVIVCLNELNTVCAYQAVVDFNKVGDVNILGYYNSEEIMTAISKNIVYATISIDTEQMGRYCIDALSDYYHFGNTSQYFTADVTLINNQNVDAFMKREKSDE
ncbi:substrate-binding domain-containing protein [Butyrivibrio sp. WCD2001]|uniref:substrate-binding domain-containing protein n=1 Tax=Butyrivibrio sp. WCD2001 TaxID=1280681 RepID=UPI00047CE108|nr:substrate-binding domain-containing protein [Butyrivibrio sp. WCD2001]